ASIPGSETQKKNLYSCVSCHSLQRIVRSTHDTAEFMAVLQRMAGYAPGASPIHPQRRTVAPGAQRNPERYRKRAEFLASGNLWLGLMLQGAIAKFDRETRTIQTFPLPAELNQATAQNAMVMPIQAHLDGKVWFNNVGIPGVHRLDLASGKLETWQPYKDM